MQSPSLPQAFQHLIDASCAISALEAAQIARGHVRELGTEIETISHEFQRTSLAGHHPNGFTKITLYRDQFRSVRLHLWQQNFGEETRVHGHAWAMASLILSGEIMHTLYQESNAEDASRYYRYKYTPGTSKGAHWMMYDGSVLLSHCEPMTVVSGQTYSMAQGDIHSSIATKAHTVTLIFADRVRRQEVVPVYSKKFFPDGYPIKPGSTLPTIS